MNKRTGLYVLFLLLFTGSLTACDHDDHLGDLRNYMNDLKKESASAQSSNTSASPQNLEQPVTYKASAIRAPFHLTTGDDTDAKQAAATPLQAFPLTVLKFVGTAAEGDAITAYILTPNNMIFQVRKGDVIGEHYGKIISIQPTLLEVEEQGGDDDKDSKIVVLQLKDNNG